MKEKNRLLLLPAVIAVFLLLLRIPSAADASGFQIECPNGMCSYAENEITVTAPEAGLLLLEIRDEYAVYRVLRESVPAGESILRWDGLGWNEERLNRKTYTFSAELQGDSGRVYQSDVRKYLETSSQALLFALPSSKTLYLPDQKEWFLEFKMVQNGELFLDFYPDGDGTPEFTLHREFSGGRITKCALSAFLGSQFLKAGEYRVCCRTKENDPYSREFRLEILDTARPVLPVTVTGKIMPEAGDTDAEIWELMRKPSVVVDLAPTSHQKVFSEKNTRSRSLGTLHGQTQGVEVFETEEGWARIGAWNHESADYIEGWVPVKALKVEEPQGDYGLLLNKREQTLTVYHQGRPIETLLVSSGRIEKNELYQETAAGCFLTDLHQADFSTNGLKYDFVIRYDGGNLLHQIPYAWGEEKKDYKAGEIYLGTKASHACIRIQAKPGPNGLNAYWLWTHLPYHTRLIILDDPEERAGERAILSGSVPDLDDPSPEEWNIVTEEIPDPDPEKYALLTFGGDAVLGGRESYYGLKEGMPEYLSAYGSAYPFSGLSTVFAADDLTSINLECVLKDDALHEDMTKTWRFRGLTSYSDILPQSSVELVNLANNHTIDYGEAGYESTIRALEGKVLSCGNGRNTLAEIRGHLFGFGGCRETTYMADPEVIDRDIRELRERGAEFVIYQCHWGEEYSSRHSKLQEAMARRCVRAGADLVVGHHPHVVQGISFIGNTPVVYSLGNLVFGGTLKLQTYDAVLLQVYFPLEHKTDRSLLLKLIPIATSSRASEKINDYHPVPLRGKDGLRILQRIQDDSAFPLADLLILEGLR